MPYAGVDIATFEILKERLVDAHDGRPPPAAIFGAGMLSSCFAQFVSYPLALVRTRLQASTASLLSPENWILTLTLVVCCISQTW